METKQRNENATTAPLSPAKDIPGGSFRSVLKNRSLLLALLQVSFVSILLLVIGELTGPFVVNVLHLPIQDLPLIFAPAGIGLVLGGLLMPSLTWRLGKSRTIALGSLSTAVGLLLIPLGRFIWSRFALPVSELLLLVSAITFVIRYNA